MLPLSLLQPRMTWTNALYGYTCVPMYCAYLLAQLVVLPLTRPTSGSSHNANLANFQVLSYLPSNSSPSMASREVVIRS